MQKHLYKSLSFLTIAVFILYWIANIQLSVFGKHRSFTGAYSFDHLIAYRWRFFTPTPHSGNQVFFIVRDRATHAVTDSIEIISAILSLKQKDAPFNQQDNVIDHLIFHAVSVITQAAAKYKQEAKTEMPGRPDSVYYNYAADRTLRDVNCIGQLTAIRHYIQGEKNIDTTGKEYEMVFAEKSIVPFKERNDTACIPSVAISLATPYKTFY
jgi:hypothetical protein